MLKTVGRRRARPAGLGTRPEPGQAQVANLARLAGGSGSEPAARSSQARGARRGARGSSASPRLSDSMSVVGLGESRSRMPTFPKAPPTRTGRVARVRPGPGGLVRSAGLPSGSG
jgi:hypothetical protein